MISLARRSCRGVRRWRIVVFVIFVGFILLYWLLGHLLPGPPNTRNTELYTYEFSATKDHFAFLHEGPDGQRDLIVYEASQKKMTVYRPRSRNIWTLAPNGSQHGGFLIGCSGGITPDQLRAGQTVTSTLF